MASKAKRRTKFNFLDLILIIILIAVFLFIVYQVVFPDWNIFGLKKSEEYRKILISYRITGLSTDVDLYGYNEEMQKEGQGYDYGAVNENDIVKNCKNDKIIGKVIKIVDLGQTKDNDFTYPDRKDYLLTIEADAQRTDDGYYIVNGKAVRIGDEIQIYSDYFSANVKCTSFSLKQYDNTTTNGGGK